MDSRIIVKNLPFHCDENSLKNYFRSCGAITDCRIIRTPSGRTRQFGFIGFQNEKSLENALKKNKTFFQQNMLSVKKALPKTSEKLKAERPWSKYTKGSSAFKKREEVLNVVREKRKIRKEKKRKERTVKDNIRDFEVYENQFKKNAWENDLFMTEPKKEKIVVDDDETSNTSIHPPPSSSKEDEQTNSLLLNKRKEISKDKEMNDLEWLQKKSEEKEEKTSKSTFHAPKKQLQEGRLFVRNLSYNCSEEDLEALFSSFGDLSEVYLPQNPKTGQSKGFGFVTFVIPENAQKAMEKLSYSFFQGRNIQVVPAFEKQNLITMNNPEGGGGGASISSVGVKDGSGNVIKSSFKKKQFMKRKKNAGSEFNWNTLYVNPSQAVSSISNQLGVSKNQILNVNGDRNKGINLPVKVALAETEILKQTRSALERLGVDVQSIHQPELFKIRSKDMILIKNMRTDSSEKEIQDLFSPFGEIRQVLVFGGGSFGLVRFFSRSEAKKAFENLSYSTFKGSPLYLEWAPLKAKKKRKKEKQEQEEEKNEKSKEDEDSSSLSESGTLFIKNLNFITTESDLRSLFKENKSSFFDEEFDEEQESRTEITNEIEEILFGEQQKQKKKKKKGKKGTSNSILQPILTLEGRIVKCSILKDVEGRSRGFGFITFSSLNDSIKAQKALNNFTLHGHSLNAQFKYLHQKEKSGEKGDGRKSDKKIIIKNLAFEANKDDLFELFSTFGQIKEIRVPSKVGSGHRGFAFVEFMSKSDCDNAMTALQNTHFYGRSLVLEYAVDDESVEKLRKSIRSELSRKRKREDDYIEFQKALKRRKLNSYKKN